MWGVRRKKWKSAGGECGEVWESVLGCGGQRWARYFFKVTAVSVPGTLLKDRRYRYSKITSTAGSAAVLLSVLLKKSSRKKVLPYILLIYE